LKKGKESSFLNYIMRPDSDRAKERAVIGTQKRSKKNFINFTPCWFNRPWPKTTKSFLLLFFKKEVLASFLSLHPIALSCKAASNWGHEHHGLSALASGLGGGRVFARCAAR
jgi:hypothetical protein